MICMRPLSVYSLMFFYFPFQCVIQFYRYNELNLTFPGDVDRYCEEELKIPHSSQQAALCVEDA